MLSIDATISQAIKAHDVALLVSQCTYEWFFNCHAVSESLYEHIVAQQVLPFRQALNFLVEFVHTCPRWRGICQYILRDLILAHRTHAQEMLYAHEVFVHVLAPAGLLPNKATMAEIAEAVGASHKQSTTAPSRVAIDFVEVLPNLLYEASGAPECQKIRWSGLKRALGKAKEQWASTPLQTTEGSSSMPPT